MEGKSDKQLRDKLTGVEFPFDPKAWDKMETMLDEKKKRRGFFWWWTGGIAAVLLVGLIGYEIGTTAEKSKVEREKLKVNTTAEEKITNDELQIANEKSKVRNQKSEINTSAVTSMGDDQKAKSKRQIANSKREDGKNTTALIRVNPSNPRHPRTNVFSSKQKRKQQLLAKANEGGANTTVSAFEKNPFQQEADMLTSAGGKNSLAERIQMDKRFALLESSEEEYSFDKKSEDALPKKKKKIFNYSLGVLANVTGTTLGSQANSSNPINRPAMFYNKPSYAIGFTHEFLFINRIAITNSILYSQTGFKVYQPSAPTDSSIITKNYSAAISELQIPLGIKVYPVVKKHFRFSIVVGIINHIKLKEKFTVEQESVPLRNILLAPLENTNVFVADNPFTGANKSLSVQDAAYTQGDQAEYYGMGGLKRYYASFYASAGVEFIAKKHFVFFTEPMFYMSLKKIGLQDKHKYNFGANAGFRYQF